jgi:predicted DNA-binding protein (MmcQ/YjbR family)
MPSREVRNLEAQQKMFKMIKKNNAEIKKVSRELKNLKKQQAKFKPAYYY